MMEALMWALLLGALAVWIVGVRLSRFRQRRIVEQALFESRIRLWRRTGDSRWLERRYWE